MIGMGHRLLHGAEEGAARPEGLRGFGTGVAELGSLSPAMLNSLAKD